MDVDTCSTARLNKTLYSFIQAMKARTAMLATLHEIITKQHQQRGNTDAVSILKEQVDDGTLTMKELQDTIIEMLFSAFHGKHNIRYR